MSRATFDEFVDSQTSAAAEQARQFDAPARLREWQEQLGIFYGTIRGFLKKYIEQKKVEIRSEKLIIKEDLLGTYEVDALTVIVGASRIHFKPVGAIILGVRGRVDMDGPKGSVKFVLVDRNVQSPRNLIRIGSPTFDRPAAAAASRPDPIWTWKIMTSPPKVAFVELVEDSFYTAMMEVVNG